MCWRASQDADGGRRLEVEDSVGTRDRDRRTILGEVFVKLCARINSYRRPSRGLTPGMCSGERPTAGGVLGLKVATRVMVVKGKGADTRP